MAPDWLTTLRSGTRAYRRIGVRNKAPPKWETNCLLLRLRRYPDTPLRRHDHSPPMPAHEIKLPATSIAADTSAATLRPERIWWPASPLARAPNTATPIAPPACRAAFNTADAVPDQMRSTEDRIAVVIAGTASPMPRGINTNAPSIEPNGVSFVKKNKRENPKAPIKLPTIIGSRNPAREQIHPLAMFEMINVAVRGRKASPACRVE